MAKKKKKKGTITRGERFLYRTFTFVSIALVVGLVMGQTTLSKINLEVQELALKVDSQEETNQSLEMKINEMSSLENIQNVSENMGLTYNNDNIKTVE